MANDKDFIVKNAVEIGKNIDVTLGSISSSTVDLSTGNYFSDTLTANTTYVFSNSGNAQTFQLEVTGASTYTITWPSSIKWTGGSAPTTPSASQTDLFTFSTDDGGTSYYGFKTATNLS